MSPAIATRQRIRDLNDAFRTAGSNGSWPWMITRGVQYLGDDFVTRVRQAVKDFDAFDTGNDPYGEHDFGAFEVGGLKLFWKIDYYDTTFSFGSEDPADPTVTRRVITIMLASEY